MQKNIKHSTRLALVQALYEWHISDNNAEEIISRFTIEKKHNKKKINCNFFRKIFSDIVENVKIYDEILASVIDRKIDMLEYVELSILRLALSEISITDVPNNVIINEAIILAKTFGAQDGYKYINAVIDRLIKEGKVRK